MKISSQNLPSRSQGSNYVGIIDIDVLVYDDIIKYASSGNAKPNSIAQLGKDIEFILSPRVPEFRDLSSYDVNFLISMRKLMSVISDGEFTLNNKRYKLSEVQYKDIDESISKVSKVLDRNFRIATIGELLDLIVNTPSEYLDRDCELAVLAADLGCTVKDLLETPSYDLDTIEFMKSKVMSQPVIGGEEGILLYGKSSDLFQNLLKLHSIDRLKISYTQDV